jgi:3-oxoacyl-[acyl-carrier protein] reductase
MGDFDGLVFLITGAATGLGAATALGAARRGARLVLNYASSKSEAETTADGCRSAGADVRLVQGSVAADEDCRRIAAAAAEWGRIDALVNNAGTTKHVAGANLDGLTAEDFQRIYGVNTIGPFQMVRASRALLEAGAAATGRASAVVNVSSIAGLSGGGSSLAYSASKAGLNALSQGLARALAPQIRVNAVCPGYIDSSWFAKGVGEAMADKVRETVRNASPLKAVSTPDDIAEVVLFLAGPQSRHMTGEIVPVDAGYRLILPRA